MDWKFAMTASLGIYAAALSSYTFYFDRRARLKIVSSILPRTLTPEHEMITMYNFIIVNSGAKRRIVEGVGFELRHQKGCTYGAPFAEKIRNRALEAGETLEYGLDSTDFAMHEHMEPKMFRLVVSDTLGKTYKTKWMTIDWVTTFKIS